MPTFAMCANYKCKDRGSCLRYRAEPSSRQTYGMFQQTNCEYHWGIQGWHKMPLIPTQDVDNRHRSN